MASSFLAHLTRTFSGPVRNLGTSLHHDNLADLDDVTETKAVGVVQTDGLGYRVTIHGFADPAMARWSCGCTITPSPRCAHVFAVALELDELLDGLREAEVEATAGESTPTPPPVRRTAVPAWRRRLHFLTASAGTAPIELPRIEYYVEGEGPYGRGPCIHVRERVRKKNGDWSGPRSGMLAAEVVERMPECDRFLLRRMAAAVRSHSYGFLGYDGDGADDFGRVSLHSAWSIDTHEMPLLAPHLRATERVFLGPVPRADETPRPLRIDCEPPFQFELATMPAKGKVGRLRVFGKFLRGDEAFVSNGASFRDRQCVIVEDRMVTVDCRGARRLASELSVGGPIDLAAGELPTLLHELSRTPGAAHFLRTQLAALPPGTPTGVVMFVFPKASEAALRATLHFDYDGVLLDAGDGRPLVTAGDAVRRRDADAEAAVRVRAVAAGIAVAAGGEYSCGRAEFPAVSAKLTGAGLRVLAEGRKIRNLLRSGGSLRSGIDWFELEGSFAFDGQAATLPELLRGKTTPEGFVELADGSYGMLPATWLRRLEALRSLGGDDVDGRVRLPASQGLLLDALLAARDDAAEFAVDAQFTALRERLAQFTNVGAEREPMAFQGELRQYQREGLGWLQFLREFGLGGCLADDMGLGKTVQVLALLLGEHASARVASDRRPSLLVAPRSVLGNWLVEAQRFAPGLRVLDFSGGDRWRDGVDERLAGCDLVLTTYALARADAATFVEREQRFHWAILDEAQAIKNADSLAAKAMRLLRANHRLVLTGTPVENRLADLWSLFEFLNPGMLGRLPAFRALFGKEATTEAMAQHRELVQRALRPVLLRRTKAQVLKDLPAKVEQTLWCDMEPPQRKRYDKLKNYYKQRLLAEPGELDQKQRFVVLEALLRLRQAACHERLLDPAASPVSAKFDELLPRLEELAAEGHKALVFSQFTSLLDLLEPELAARNLKWERLDGSTTKRPERIARFQTDADCPVFLISLKAGGYGLNLTAASYVFLLDPWWNPAVEMQAIDRAHRIGQQRTVNAYRLVCRGTVEERVLELQAEKRALCEAILGNERSLLQDLSRADLELLLG